MINKAVKIICIATITIFVWCGIAVADDGFRTDSIYLAGNVASVLKNADGDDLIVSNKNALSGTMEVLKKDLTETIPSNYILTVRESPSYEYEQIETGEGYCSIMDASDNYISLKTTDKCKSEILFRPTARVNLSGSSQWISVNVTMRPSSPDYTISGRLAQPISIEYKNDDLVIKGARGKYKIEIEGKKKSESISGYYYLFVNQTVLGTASGEAFVSDAVKLVARQSSRPVSLYVRPANNGKHMALTWTKVKKAKSYVVYRYDTKRHKYKRMAVRNGQSSNYYITPVKGNAAYTYKVVARAGKNGRGKRIGKASYAVTAVPQTASKGNAKAVKIESAKTLKMKRGRSVRLKASVESPAEPLYSGKVRWCVSNRKVLKVNTMTGKIKAKKKGTCYVWAKAHNGLNSKKIKVVVK